MIEYVDKIVDMRRNQVLMQGALPPEAQTALQNIEKNSNPWGIGYSTRGDWAAGLGVKTLAEDKGVEYLYFAGCAGSFDERAKKVSKAFVKLLQKAGVSFGILGAEEKCTGDSARRIGNEYLFQLLAKDNIATFEKYGVKKILTTCPHCYNTLKNEYPQFGGRYEVQHHTEFLLELMRKGLLSFPPPIKTFGGNPRLRGDQRESSEGHEIPASAEMTLTYHDSCYLGRYNDVYDPPREVLAAAGVELVEAPERFCHGLCCGAGGAQYFMEEQTPDRMNVRRTEQLVSTGAKTIATACPFCMTMLTDGLKARNLEETIRQLDVAEILWQACSDEAPAKPAEPEKKPEA
jgi:Fe-S oxidoreductase